MPARPSSIPNPFPDRAQGSTTMGQPDRPAALETDSSRDERIRRAAYVRYQHRQGDDGTALDDWLAAEAEVDAESDFQADRDA